MNCWVNWQDMQHNDPIIDCEHHHIDDAVAHIQDTSTKQIHVNYYNIDSIINKYNLSDELKYIIP